MSDEKYGLAAYDKLVKIQNEKDVYLVMHRTERKLYILKEVPKDSRELYWRLENMKIADIPAIYSITEDNEKLWVVEDYIHGRNLQEKFDQSGIFPEEEVICIMQALCRILAKLHQAVPPLIHRDIKPSNIMLSEDGVIKLIDFNAAREYHWGESEDTRCIGTKEFAAPEQYGFSQTDARTDIYALGVTMNCLLTGKPPKIEIATGKLQPVITRCIQMDPKNRYQTVQDLSRDLDSRKDNGGSVETLSGEEPQREEPQREKATGEEQPTDTHEPEHLTKEKKGLYAYRAYLPVGFRSGNIGKMLLATLLYLLIIFCTYGSKNEIDGKKLTGAVNAGYSAGSFLVILSWVFLAGNYEHIWNYLPGMNKKGIVRLLLGLGYGMAVLVIFILIVSVINA